VRDGEARESLAFRKWSQALFLKVGKREWEEASKIEQKWREDGYE
jgi:hypothetical protein